jgi:hypothetical protein
VGRWSIQDAPHSHAKLPCFQLDLGSGRASHVNEAKLSPSLPYSAMHLTACLQRSLISRSRLSGARGNTVRHCFRLYREGGTEKVKEVNYYRPQSEPSRRESTLKKRSL